MTKRPKIIHLNSKEIYYNINNLPIPQATGGTTYWSLSQGEQILAEISTNANEKGSMQIEEFEGKLGLLIRYNNLSFVEPYTGITITLTYGDTVITGDTQVTAKVTFEELLSMNIDIELLEAHPMILEYTTTSANQEVMLPLSGSVDTQVDWGDGSEIEHVTTNHPAHTYTDAGIYDVKVKGKVTDLNSYNISLSYKEFLTKVKSWGKLEGLTLMHNAFNRCTNLKEMPADEYGCFKNVTNFENCFYYCTGLTSIPEELFVNCSNVTTFFQCFSNCSGLTGEIPENLFANCPNVTDFGVCFSNCSGLTGEIPATLFSNCPNVTNFNQCFVNCNGLTGEIPATLFSNCPNARSFLQCFSGCSGLTSIPKELFSNCPNVTSFYSCFEDCTGLTFIPDGLFNNCPNVTTFRKCFGYCSGLTGETPKDTLKDGTKIELWERVGKAGYPSSITGTNCFISCTKLSNYRTIPSGWK